MTKFAANYFDELLKNVKSYHPFQTGDAYSLGIPTGAALGGAIGGLAGAIKDPGYEYDEQGHIARKSRLKEALKGMLAGGTIGGLGAAALPTIGPPIAGALAVAKNDITNPNSSMPDWVTSAIASQKAKASTIGSMI